LTCKINFYTKRTLSSGGGNALQLNSLNKRTRQNMLPNMFAVSSHTVTYHLFIGIAVINAWIHF